MAGGKRKGRSAEFKAKVAVAAIRGERTINELAGEYEVHPTLVTKWKNQVLACAPEIFKNGRKKERNDEEALRSQLYEEIGRLKVEADWLKKKLGY